MNNPNKSRQILHTSALLAMAAVSTASHAQTEQPFEMTPIDEDAIDIGQPDQDEGGPDKDGEGTCGGGTDREGACGADKSLPGHSSPPDYDYESDPCNLFPDLPVCQDGNDNDS